MQGIPEYQVQVPLGGLPVNLVLVGNQRQGRLAFVKVRSIPHAVFDMTEDGQYIRAMFNEDNFVIFHPDNAAFDGEFAYNYIYDYKDIPVMLDWLKAQNLQEPNTIFG